MLKKMPRAEIGFFPTPIVALKRLSARVGGPSIFMKRDDQTGVACGGNKVRKLEFLIGEALAQGADCVITAGAAQSNHCRQTAAAAAMVGLGCHLALGGEAPVQFQGNLLLDHLLGSRLHWCGADRKGERIPDIVAALQKEGAKPYVIPYGGSNVTGAMGFIDAVRELDQQVRDSNEIDPTHLVFASSSGGTHAGLMVGKQLCHHSCAIVGIAIDKESIAGVPLSKTIRRLASDVAKRLGKTDLCEGEDVILETGYAEPGYGVVTSLEREAIALVAELEGILLDPVYTSRAMGGLIDMIRKGHFSNRDSVLFWHTGGTPALFSYAADLQANMPSEQAVSRTW